MKVAFERADLDDMAMSFATTREPLFVLDKNNLRAASATMARNQADAAGFGVLVIDTTFKEIVRGGNWPDHYERDFRDWTDRPERMSVSWGIAELLREERQSGSAASIVDAQMTQRHRELLVALPVGNREALVAATPRALAEGAQLAAEGGPLNAPERVYMMRALLDVWWRQGDGDARRVIQSEAEDPAEPPLLELGRIAMGQSGVRQPLEPALGANGYSPDIARALMNGPTFTNFLHSSFVAYSLLLWAQGQRLAEGDVNPNRFLNQMLDLDYVAYGLCCAGLFTNERMIRRLEAGLRTACGELWV